MAAISIPEAKKYAEMHGRYVSMATSFVHSPLPQVAVESAQVQALGEMLDDIHLMLRQLLALHAYRQTGAQTVAERHGRWIVVDSNGNTDGWSYPTENAAREAAANPDWADAYRLRQGAAP